MDPVGTTLSHLVLQSPRVLPRPQLPFGIPGPRCLSLRKPKLISSILTGLRQRKFLFVLYAGQQKKSFDFSSIFSIKHFHWPWVEMLLKVFILPLPPPSPLLLFSSPFCHHHYLLRFFPFIFPSKPQLINHFPIGSLTHLMASSLGTVSPSHWHLCRWRRIPTFCSRSGTGSTSEMIRRRCPSLDFRPFSAASVCRPPMNYSS